MIKSDNFDKTRDKDIRKMFIMSFTAVPNRIKQLFNVLTSGVATEKIAGVGDMTNIGEFTGKISYYDILQEDELSKSHTEYVGGLQIQRKVADDDQQRIIKQLPRQLGERMAYRRQQDGTAIFNNAFNSNYTYLDGVSLCNSSHNAASTSTTWDNTGTEKFSPANVKATRLLSRKFTSAADNIISIIPNLILGPIDKEDEMEEVFKTRELPYSSDNTINVLYGGKFQYVAWEFLTSTTAWFTMSKALMLDNLLWFNRKQTEFHKDIDTDTYIRKYSAYMRYVPTAVDWRFVYGSNATS